MMFKRILFLSVMATLVVVPFASARDAHGVSPAFITGPVPASPAFGDTVTFQVGGYTDADFAWASLYCYQGKTVVLRKGFNLAGETSVSFVLGPTADNPPFSSAWTIGAASCRAEMAVLWGKNHKVVDQVLFEVAA